MRTPALALLLAQLTSPSARADDDPAAIEHLLGATDQNAAIGNGGLTAGFSSQGELTLLRWPSPSFYEHVDFVSSTAVDARQQPHFGAADNQGSFAGVMVDPGGGLPAVFAWARDAGWTADQRYAADDSNQLSTTLHSATLKVTVRFTDAVVADLDVLSRRIEVTPDPGFSPAALRLVYFENFSPTVEKTEFYPVDQTNLLAKRDYALAMSAARDALVHFSALGRPPALVAPLAAAATPSAVDAFLDGTIAQNPQAAGTYLLLGGDRPPDAFQCGYDQPPPMGAAAPRDAYDDAAATLGALSGSAAVLDHGDGALAWSLPTGGGSVELFLAAGGTLEAATQALDAARTRGGDQIRSDDRAYWSQFLAPARLPATDDPDRLRLAKRALLSIAVGRDRQSGAIVASVSAQPPYDLDWPRDGAFIDYALDVAGYHDWVSQHRAFYAQVQRQQNGDDSAGGDAYPGSWAMNFYADGHPGGPVPLEIDEVGFALWMDEEHAAWLDGDDARRAYLATVWPSISLAADFLTQCVDPATGLQCLENEDDHFTPSITLHGASIVRLGLDSAIRAANFLGHQDEARRWRARLDQLDPAIDRAFSDPMLGFVGQTNGSLGGPTGGGTGAVAWSLWPAELRPIDDPRMAASARQIAADYGPFFARQTGGGSYYGKGLVALARFDHATGDAAGTAQVASWLDLMVRAVPTPGTGHYGESVVDAGGQFTNVTAIPHLWEATLTYLALMAVYSPDDFAPPPLADDAAPPAGCGCRIGARRSSPWWASLVAIALVSSRRSRRRPRRPL